MATRTHVAVCLLCLVSPSITHSQDLSQNELNAAASQHLASSDFMLNKAYEQLSGALDGDRKELLEAAQQAWIEFHDLNAEVIFDCLQRWLNKATHTYSSTYRNNR